MRNNGEKKRNQLILKTMEFKRKKRKWLFQIEII